MFSAKPPSAKARPGGARQWLVALALIALCAIPYYRSYQHRNESLDEDEIYWIGQAYYYHLAVEAHDWTNADWQLLPARENPALGKYIIGAGLRLDSLSVTNPDWLGVFYLIATQRHNAWGTGRDYQDRLAVISRMTPAVGRLAIHNGEFDCPIQYVTTARAVMMLFGMLSVAAVYWLAAQYTGQVMALLAALLFALHPATVAAYTKVSVDILAVAFSLLSVIHFVLIERRVWRQWRRPKLGRALVCVGGGLCLAFAVGSKMNAAVVGFLGLAMGLVWLVSFLRCKAAESCESSMAMLAVLLLALVVFVASNPVDYPNPLQGVWNTYADQQRSLAVQQHVATFQRPVLTVGDRIVALAELTALQPAIFLLAVAAFFWDLIHHLRRGKPLPVVSFWWFIAVMLVGLWLPFARSRYILPVLVPSVLLVCIAAGNLFGKLRPRSP